MAGFAPATTPIRVHQQIEDRDCPSVHFPLVVKGNVLLLNLPLAGRSYRAVRPTDVHRVSLSVRRLGGCKAVWVSSLWQSCIVTFKL